MPFGNYHELQHAITDWLDREDLNEKVTDFIRLAEIRVQRAMDLPSVDKAATGNLVAAQDFITLPTDLLDITDMTITGTDPIHHISIVSRQTLRDVREKNESETVPFAGHIQGFTMELAPTPQGTSAYEILYRSGVPALSLASPTNRLLTDYPDLLLYGGQVEARIYTEDWDGAKALADGPYADAMKSAKRQAARLRMGGGPLRVRADVVV